MKEVKGWKGKPLDLALKNVFLQYQACSHEDHKIDCNRQEDGDKSRKGRGWGQMGFCAAMSHERTQGNGQNGKKDQGQAELEISDQALNPQWYARNSLSCEKYQGDDIDAQYIDQSVH